MGTRIYSQVGGDPSTSGNVNFEGPPTAAASSLTGNPYIDTWGDPSDIDDEFDDGPDSLIARGFAVWDYVNGVALTYGGRITNPAAPTTPTEFRSTRYGTNMVVQVGAGQGLMIMRPVVDINNQVKQYTVRASIPWGRSLSSGNNSATVLSGGAQVALVRSQNAFGTNPTTGNNWQKVFVGQRAGANALYGWERPGFQKLMDPTDQYSSSVLHGIDGFYASVETNRFKDLAALDTASGSVRMAFREEDGAENAFLAQQVGFQFFSQETGGAGGPTATFMIDYFRQRLGTSWYGLS